MEKFQVITAEKPDDMDISVEDAKEALASSYPDYEVEVYDQGHQFIAKLTKIAAEDEEDEEEDGPPAKKKVPPFLEEKGDKENEDDDGDADGDDDDGEGELKPKKKKEEGDPDGDDLGFQDGGDLDKGTSDVVKALKALKELQHVLPKLQDQLKGLNGGDDLGGLPPDDHVHGPVPPPPGHPAPDVGPTPGAPPGAAEGKTPFAPPAVPNVNHGLDQRKGPPVGVPTFGKAQEKFINRPVQESDGTRLSHAQASQQLEEHPKYADYYVHELKYDPLSDQWVAHLKLK